jgi:large subunit ribosomal protein L32
MPLFRLTLFPGTLTMGRFAGLMSSGSRARWWRFTDQVTVMAVPKRRHSNSRTNRRRSHHAKKPKQLQTCPQCSYEVPSHVVCPNCGHYMGRKVVKTEE